MKIPLLDNKYLKGALGAIGVILIGAIGSGVWDVVIKPLSTVLRNVLLDLISLGLESLRRDIYSSIARGFDQSISIQLLFYFVVGAILVMVFGVMGLLYRRNELRGSRSDMLKKVDDLLLEVDGAEETKTKRKAKTLGEIKEELVELREEIVRSSFRLLSIMVYVSVFLYLLSATVIVVDLVKASYVNSAISHYDQIVAISMPYYTAEEIGLHHSQFAQIKNKEDYIQLTASIERTIKNHNIIPPAFSPW